MTLNIKKFLELSNHKLAELENKYNQLPSEYEIENLSLSYDKACLKSTAEIARKRSLNRQTSALQKKLSEKRKQAILTMFVRPKD